MRLVTYAEGEALEAAQTARARLTVEAQALLQQHITMNQAEMASRIVDGDVAGAAGMLGGMDALFRLQAVIG